MEPTLEVNKPLPGDNPKIKDPFIEEPTLGVNNPLLGIQP